MIRTTTTAVVFVCSFFLISNFDFAFSQTDRPSQSTSAKVTAKVTAKSMVASMDQDGDGKINKEESPAQLSPYFDGIDVNSDGFIDVGEAKVMADYANNQNAESQEEEMDPDEELTSEKMIELLDKNGDKKLSKEEITGEVKKHFDMIDSNRDGLIDNKEVSAALAYAKNQGNAVTVADLKGDPNSTEMKNGSVQSSNPEEAVASMDKDGDGKITKEEAPEDLVLFFGNYDTNDDKVIDKKEAKAIVAYLRRHGAKSKKATKKKQMGGKVTAQSIIDSLDKDGDGKISKEESPPELLSAFSYIDTNKDDVIDVKEAQEMADYQNQNQ